MKNASSAKTAPAKTAPAKTAPANAMADLVAAVTTSAKAEPTAKVPASVAVLASITAKPTLEAMPSALVKYAKHTIHVTKKGAGSRAIAARVADNAKGGACPFLKALLAGEGKTLESVWPKDAGHAQQGRGKGGYNAVSALRYYTEDRGWFTLNAPAK